MGRSQSISLLYFSRTGAHYERVRRVIIIYNVQRVAAKARVCTIIVKCSGVKRR